MSLECDTTTKNHNKKMRHANPNRKKNAHCVYNDLIISYLSRTSMAIAAIIEHQLSRYLSFEHTARPCWFSYFRTSKTWKVLVKPTSFYEKKNF